MDLSIINELLAQVQKAPYSLLVILGLNLIGVVLKMIPQIPNYVIPMTLMLVLGPLAMIAEGNNGTVNPDMRYPIAIFIVQGVIFGFVSWVLHATLLKRFEKYLPAGLLGDATPEPPKPPPTT
jgi:hypothetical protein